MTASKTTQHLSDEQVQALLEQLKGADSAELKLSIPELHQRSTVAALDMDPLEAQIRQVFFFDTPDLALNRAGVVARARRVQQKSSDSVIKLRPIDSSLVTKELRKSPNFGIEVDAMPGGFVCSGSMKGLLTAVRETISGNGSVRKLFSKEQRAFYKEHAPLGLEFDDLSVLGPIFVLKLRWVPKEIKRRVVAEMWLYPDGTRLLELSTKCLPTQAFDTAAEMRGFLSGRGIDLSGAQETKTKKALDFFARDLSSAAANGAD